jgi:hypothetical protein
MNAVLERIPMELETAIVSSVASLVIMLVNVEEKEGMVDEDMNVVETVIVMFQLVVEIVMIVMIAEIVILVVVVVLVVMRDAVVAVIIVQDVVIHVVAVQLLLIVAILPVVVHQSIEEPAVVAQVVLHNFENEPWKRNCTKLYEIVRNCNNLH